MPTQNFKIYLINIDTRVDKYMKMESQLNKLGYIFERISAKTPDNTSCLDLELFPPQTVQANWLSHLEVYNNLIKTKNEFCLVLEDDCIFSNSFGNFLEAIENMNSFDFDILQIGYLELDNKISKNTIIVATLKLKIYKIVLEIINYLNIFLKDQKYFTYISRRISKLKYLIVSSKKLNSKHLIVEEFISGTHAYIIHRSMALKILSYNKPITMGADLALQMLSISGNWKIFRTACSYAKQDDLFPDIGVHSSQAQDISPKLLEDFNI